MTINYKLITINKMEIDNSKKKILLILLKDFTQNYTITSLAKELKITRTGTWKILKKLENQQLIILKPLGKGKTSTYNIKLNWNQITEKTLSLYLTEEATKQARWVNNFEELKDKISSEKQVEYWDIEGKKVIMRVL